MTEDHSPLCVEVRGKTQGPGVETFLLVHGFGASKYSWRHWVPPLEARGRVVLIDMKGFGDSEKPDDGAYAPSDQVELIRSVIERESPEHLTVAGHSLGGGIALLLALRLLQSGDGRLRRLVIVAGAAYKQRLPPFVKLAAHPKLSGLGLRLLGVRRTISFVLRSIVYDRSAVTSDQVRAYAEPLYGRGGIRAMFDVARRVVPDDLDELTALYPRIRVPALLLWGRGDRVVPLWVGERLARELPDATLHVLEQCGHIPHEERPEETIELLEAFLAAEA